MFSRHVKHIILAEYEHIVNLSLNPFVMGLYDVHE